MPAQGTTSPPQEGGILSIDQLKAMVQRMNEAKRRDMDQSIKLRICVLFLIAESYYWASICLAYIIQARYAEPEKIRFSEWANINYMHEYCLPHRIEGNQIAIKMNIIGP